MGAVCVGGGVEAISSILLDRREIISDSMTGDPSLLEERLGSFAHKALLRNKLPRLNMGVCNIFP